MELITWKIAITSTVLLYTDSVEAMDAVSPALDCLRRLPVLLVMEVGAVGRRLSNFISQV